jgi:hypothetical protein
MGVENGHYKGKEQVNEKTTSSQSPNPFVADEIYIIAAAKSSKGSQPASGIDYRLR